MVRTLRRRQKAFELKQESRIDRSLLPTMSVQVKRKIPIPSFAPPPTRTNDDAVAETVKLVIDVQGMIHLDNALQLHLHQQKQEATPISEAVISFADFSNISSKVETSSPEAENSKLETPSEEELPDLVNLSKTERMWHDLYCIGVPTLYRASSQNGETNDAIPRAKKRRRLAAMALELKPAKDESSKNRVGELRRLAREAGSKGISKSKSNKALSLLRAFRQEKENQKEPTNSTGSSSMATNDSSIVDSLLRDKSAITNGKANKLATTIDDRIRARAKERERNLEQAKAARKDPREERVAIADALYSYACHVLRRKQSRSKFSTNKTSNQKKASATKCVLTFCEIVQKGLPNRSRKEITRIMSDIVKVLSKSSSSKSLRFLKWKDPKTGQAFGVPISKNTVVTIDTSDFKTVREILNREQI